MRSDHPSRIISDLDSALELTIAQAELEIKEKVFGFELTEKPNYLFELIHSSSQAVHQFIGLCEHVGYVPRFGGHFKVSAYYLAQSSYLLNRFSVDGNFHPESVSLLLRASDTSILKKPSPFSPLGVALLPERVACEISHALISGFDKWLAEADTNKTDEEHFFGTPAYALFALGLLEKLCQRLPDTELTALLKKVIGWYTAAPIYQDPSIYSDFSQLFCQIIQATPNPILSENCLNLLTLPIVQGRQEESQRYFSWKDPIECFPMEILKIRRTSSWDRLAMQLIEELTAKKLKIGIADSGVENADALGIAAKGGSTVRQQKDKHDINRMISIYYWRILWMLENNLLSKKTQTKLADYAWKDTPQDAIPDFPDMFPHAILTWPTPNNISDLYDRYKNRLLSEPIPLAGTPTEDGRVSYSSRYRSLLFDSLHIGMKYRKKIKFTDPELIRLLSRFREYKFLNRVRTNFLEYERRPMIRINWLLSYIIGSQLQGLEKTLKWLPKWFASLITANNNLGMRWLRTEVLQLFFTPENASSLANKIEEYLYDNNGENMLEAGYAITLWRSQVNSFIECPEFLVKACPKAFRLLPISLSTKLSKVLEEQFRYYHDEFQLDESDVQSILGGLIKNADNIDYHRLKNKISRDHLREAIQNFDEIPEYRCGLAKFIVEFSSKYPQIKQNSNFIKLEKSFEQDPLAEVRRLFT